MRHRIVLFAQDGEHPFRMARNDQFHFDLDGAITELRAQVEVALKEGRTVNITIGLEPEKFSNEKLV